LVTDDIFDKSIGIGVLNISITSVLMDIIDLFELEIMNG
jgi:hypothetical protein